MTWAAGYGVGVLALGLIAWLSGDRTTRIMLVVLGLEWLVCNAAIGDDRWWAANPTTIATVSLAATAMARFLPVNRLTLTLMALYGASMLLAVWAAFAGLTLNRWYFEAINGIFALRLIVVGGWGGWCAVRHRGAMGADRPLRLPKVRATVALRSAFSGGRGWWRGE